MWYAKMTAMVVLYFTVLTSAWSADSLPSWNEGETKQAILRFVQDITAEGQPTFVPTEDRIAVFDNDGTLWCEQPAYPQFIFGMDQVRLQAARHPEWKDKEPFQSALTGNLDGVVASGVKGLNELPMAAGEGLTLEQYNRVVTDWLAVARHPRFGCAYTECVYQPMLELLAYLRANGFKTYIVSGGELEFMRPWTEAVYGIPPEQVIGSMCELELEQRDGKPVIIRSSRIGLINDKTDKVLSIQRVIGRRPIAAFGNSDGDLPMLQWAASGPGLRFCMYIHHTDGDREYAYDREAAVGRLDKGLAEAARRGWVVVDMTRDWSQVFPPKK